MSSGLEGADDAVTQDLAELTVVSLCNAADIPVTERGDVTGDVDATPSNWCIAEPLLCEARLSNASCPEREGRTCLHATVRVGAVVALSSDKPELVESDTAVIALSLANV